FMPRDARTELLPSEKERSGEAIGKSLEMRKVFGVLERVSPTDVTILLEGETGTGKDLVARAIHLQSSRREGAVVVCDCGGVAPTDVSRLLAGETRTGNDLVDRASHLQSSRRECAFVGFDCGVVAPDQIEEGLFGQEASATATRRSGVFQLADGETVFLDEIG